MTDCDRPVRYMCSPWKCAVCCSKERYKTPQPILTEDWNISEWVSTDESKRFFIQEKLLSDQKVFSFYLFISQILFSFSLKLSKRVLMFCLFVFPLSFCFWQRIQKKWVIISYQFVEKVIFVLKPNLTFLILFFQKDSISNILELN